MQTTGLVPPKQPICLQYSDDQMRLQLVIVEGEPQRSTDVLLEVRAECRSLQPDVSLEREQC